MANRLHRRSFMEHSDQAQSIPSQRLVCLRCNYISFSVLSPEKLCSRCGFSLVPPPAYLGWEPLDVMMFKFSNALLDIQKLTSIWTWIVTEETRPEDVASVLPCEKSEPQNTQVDHSVNRQKRKFPLLWWILTTLTLVIVFYLVLTGVM